MRLPILIFVLSIFTNNADACPLLAGKYLCSLQGTTQTGEMVINQSTIWGYDLFNIIVGDANMDLLTDGQVRDVSSSFYNSKEKYWCENQLLRTWVYSERIDEYYTSTTNSFWKKTENGNVNVTWHVLEKGKYNSEYIQIWDCKKLEN